MFGCIVVSDKRRSSVLTTSRLLRTSDSKSHSTEMGKAIKYIILFVLQGPQGRGETSIQVPIWNTLFMQ
jgi:hypothetical protein